MVNNRIRSRRGALAAFAAAVVLATSGLAGAAGTLRASLDRDAVDVGDTVRLTLRDDGDGEPQRTDLEPLATDFEVLGTEQSQQIRVVNGRVQASRALDVVLSPRRSGTLTVPALRAGDLTSEPLTLEVRDAAASGAAATAPGAARTTASGAAPDLFVEAVADQTSPFVQGEVRYTVRVFDGVGIREGALTEPAAPGLRVGAVGDTKNYEQSVNGRRYMVHEREYALFPQTSGAVTVPPVVLQARVAEPQRGRGGRSAFDDAFADGFGDDVLAEMLAQMRAGGFGSALLDRMMSPGREVRVRSNPVTLSVQGRPAGASDGWFLPARAVTLTQSWQPANPTFRVGETVRRTITLRADGASAQQLPKLEVPDVAGVKHYAGPSEQRDVPSAGGVAAELVQSFDLLPSEPGRFTLPQIDVAWWDTAAQTQRTATVAAQTIEVLPAPGTQSAQSSAATAPQPAPAAGSASVESATVAADTAKPSTTSATAPDGGIIAALRAHPTSAAGALLALLAIAAGAVWSSRRRRRRAASATPDASCTASRVPARALADALHQACTANDARAVRDALLAWGRATWSVSPPSNAGALARRLGHPGFTQAVKSLDDSLYAPHVGGFDGSTLWREFNAARKAPGNDSTSPPEPLPALYPTSRVA